MLQHSAYCTLACYPNFTDCVLIQSISQDLLKKKGNNSCIRGIESCVPLFFRLLDCTSSGSRQNAISYTFFEFCQFPKKNLLKCSVPTHIQRNSTEYNYELLGNMGIFAHRQTLLCMKTLLVINT